MRGLVRPFATGPCSADDNIHVQGTEFAVRLIEVRETVQDDGLPEPQSSAGRGKGATYHLHSLMRRYFYEHLKPE